MKIAILGIKTFPAQAGADRVVEEIISRFPKTYEFYIYLSKKDNKEFLECYDNFHFIYIPTVKGKHLKAFIFFLFTSIHVLVKGKYDVINIHNSDFGLFNPIIYIKNKNIIATFHGSGYKRDKWSWFAKRFLMFSEFLFIRFNKIITVVSDNILNDIPLQYHSKVKYIPNGIDPQSIIIDSSKFDYVKYGLTKGNYFFFSCGRLDKTKGLHHLIRAYIIGNYKHKLLVIGDFTHDENYSKNIREMCSVNKNIILYENLVSKPVLFDILKNSKLFIFPSELEAMSMMLLEAIAVKTNVICSNIYENIAVVGNNYKYLFKDKNVNDLKQKIDLFLSDGSANFIKEKLFDSVNTKFNWNNIVDKYKAVYDEIIKKVK